MMNRNSGLLTVILLVTVAAVPMAAAEPPSAPVRLLSMAPADASAGSTLEVRLSGPFSYTSYQPDGRNLIVDLAGTVSDSSEPASVVGVSWLKKIRVLPYRNAGGNQVLRLDLTLNHDCVVDVSKSARATLSLECESGARDTARATTPKTVPLAVASRAAPAAGKRAISSGPVTVRSVRARNQQGGFAVDIRTTAPTRYETLILENPDRLVLDVPGGILQGRARKLTVENDWVSSVRIAQFKADPPVTRVVLDMKKVVPHRVEETDTGLRIVLAHRPNGESAITAKKPAKAAGASAQDSTATETANRIEQDSRGLSESVQPAPQRTIDPIQVASLAPMVPASAVSDKARLPASATNSEARLPASTKPTGLAPVLPAAVTPPPAPTATPLPVYQDTSVPAPAAPEASPYSGERISVNLKDVDLQEFFRLIHEISGLNIVLDPNVAGSVTLIMIDVPWDQILDIVLRNSNLDKTIEGNVLRIASRATLKQESEDERELAQARAEAVDPVTVTRRLNYARAANLEATLTRFLSSRGQIMRDDRLNMLIVKDIPSVIPAIDDLLRQLDRKSQQVEIEARVVSASRNFSRAIGSQIATSAGTRNRKQLWGGGLGTEGFVERTVPPLPPVVVDGSTGTAPGATDLPVVGATSGLFYNYASANLALDIILTAAESRGIAKVLSRPRVITQNNVKATVTQGFSIPIQTQIQQTVSVTFVDAALLMEVTPQITGDGNVFLDIKIENNRPDFANSVGGNPSILTQAATTQVLVNDGGTVVIGGVLITDNSTTVDQVPFLGSIPVIGHLFKRNVVATSTQELLFFITPRIMPD